MNLSALRTAPRRTSSGVRVRNVVPGLTVASSVLRGRDGGIGTGAFQEVRGQPTGSAASQQDQQHEPEQEARPEPSWVWASRARKRAEAFPAPPHQGERPRRASCQSAASSLLRGMTHRNVVGPEEALSGPTYPIRRKVCPFLLGAGRRGRRNVSLVCSGDSFIWFSVWLPVDRGKVAGCARRPAGRVRPGLEPRNVRRPGGPFRLRGC